MGLGRAGKDGSSFRCLTVGGDGGGGSLLESDNGSLLAGEKYLEFKSSETLNAPRRLISSLVMLRGTLTALLRGSLPLMRPLKL